MRIRLSPAARLDITDDGIQAASPRGRFALRGRDVQVFVEQLLPLLDGERTADDLAEAVDGYSAASVRKFVDLLLARGVAEAVPDGAGPPSRASQRRLLAQLGVDPDAATRALAAAHVAIVGLEPLGIVAAAELAAAGVGSLALYDDRPITDDDATALHGTLGAVAGRRSQVAAAAVHRADPTARATAGPIPPPLRRADMAEIHTFDPVPTLVLTALRPEEMLVRFHVERATQAASVPSLSGTLEGTEAWIGPLAVPSTTACWNCLRMRRLAHRDDVLAAHAEQAKCMSPSPPPSATAALAPMPATAGGLLATEALKWLTGAGRDLVGRTRVHELVGGTTTLHGIVRMPWCPVCGGAQQSIDAARAAGQDLSRVDASLVRDLPTLYGMLEGWLDPRTGVIKGFDHHAPHLPPLPRTANVRAAHYTEGDPNRVDVNLFGGGKGLTDFSAQIGAIGEVIERYSASRYRDSDLVRARLDELEGDVVDPRRLCLYDDAVYAASDNPYVRYDPSMPLHWVRGHWFGTDRPVWVPALAAFFSYRAPQGEQIFQVSSSGLAAGASTLDAAVRATFELLERDAVMLSWLCQLPGRRILLDMPFGDGTDEVVASVHALGVRIELYLMDMGTGVPTVFGCGFGDGVHAPAAAASLACHGDLRTAVRKSLLELAHVYPYLRTITPERIPHTPEGVRTLEEHAFFYLPPGRERAFDFLRYSGVPPLPLSAIPAHTFPSDPRAATATLAQRLHAADLRVAIVDLTSPDVMPTPYRVARAVGLDVQPIHFGYTVRRLRNPRLHARLGPMGLHPMPHPIA